MARYIRNTALLAKLEVTEGVDALPLGASNAMLISDVSIVPLNAQNVDRSLVRPYFGGSEQLVGTAYVSIDFTVELSGSGTVGTAPAWNDLIRACGFIDTIDAAYVAYVPDTPANQKSVTLYYHDDGLVHKLLGAKGTLKIGTKVGDRPTMKFSFMGKKVDPVPMQNPAVNFSAWKAPLVVTNRNTGRLVFGGAYAAGVVTGGVDTRASQGLELDIGNQTAFTPLVGAEYIDITDRTVTGSIALDLSAADEAAFFTNVLNNALSSMSIEHGTVAGAKVGIFMPAVQLIAPKKSEVNGRRLAAYDLRAVPVAGNDDIIIYCK